MKFTLAFLIFLIACQSKQGKQASGQKTDAIYLNKFNPTPGNYLYDIISETKTELDVNGKMNENSNRTEITLKYTITKDSSGNIVLGLIYEKIKMHLKTGESDSELDAASAGFSLDPVERMFGFLMNEKISATIDPSGKVIHEEGVDALTQKVLSSLAASDNYTRDLAVTQWDKLVKNGVVKKNIDQLLSLFPDSTIQEGDTWNSKEILQSELGLLTASNFTLTEIDQHVARISITGKIISSDQPFTMMGYSVTSHLNGQQKGNIVMDLNAGMLDISSQTNTVKGTIIMMGREIPVNINSSLVMKRRD